MKNLSLNTFAAGFVMLSGALHIISFAVDGFSYGILGFAPAGIFFIALGYALYLSASRLLAHIAFLATGIGASYILREVFVTLTTPSWWFTVMFVVSAATVATLFLLLWRSPETAET